MEQNEVGEFLRESAARLYGTAKRIFIAQAVLELYEGVVYRAAQATGWSRTTIKKSLEEQKKGSFENRPRKGRSKAEELNPELLDDIRALCEPSSQADPTLRTTRLYTRFSAAEVRRLLSEIKGYPEERLPSEATVRTKMRNLGFFPQRVSKTKPKKSLPKRTQSLKKSSESKSKRRAAPTS